jgi:hypothetical protein
MSMILALKAAPDSTLALLGQEPRWVHSFLGGEVVDPTPRTSPGLLGWLFRKRPPASVLPSVPEELLTAGLPDMDTDKAWHGIHFLLAGDAWEKDAAAEAAVADDPSHWLLYGGKEVGTEDVGYGPARMLVAADVARWADFLDGFSEDELSRRYDAEEMAKQGVYPDIWKHEPKEEAFDGYLLPYFRELRVFVRAAADAGHGIVLSLC